MPPMPRGSLRCFRKKYSSHHCLNLRVQRGIERRQRIPADLVEVLRVFLEAVIGRQVHAAAEPEHRVGAVLHRDEHAHVHVHRGGIGVARMEHQRHAHRLPAPAGQLGAVRGGGGRHAVALHMRERDAAALQHVALLEDAADAFALADSAAAAGALPLVAQELLAVHLFQPFHDQLLQFEQEFLDCGAIHLPSGKIA